MTSRGHGLPGGGASGSAVGSDAELDAFLAAARATVGESAVLTDPDLTEGYSVDWTRRWRSSAPAVVRPATTDEVAALVAAARRHGVALVPQGGNTGLVGGSVPHTGAEVVLSLRRLDDLGPVDVLAGQVTAGAGVTLAALQAHAAAAGLAFGIDTGARASATVGGMIATNAGGVHVVRHGPMRAQVIGVEAVLGTGEVVSRLGGLVKDNTGYDLGQLLCGSEGTLGVVTAARLRLVADEPHVVVALLGVAGVGEAVSLASELRHEVGDVRALEVMEGDSIARGGLPPGWASTRDARRGRLPAGRGRRPRRSDGGARGRDRRATPRTHRRPWAWTGRTGNACGAGARRFPRLRRRWAWSSSST